MTYIGCPKMDGKAKDYLKRADECDFLAAFSDDAKVKAGYRDLARQWRELADLIERHQLR